MGYEREELIAIGERFQTGLILEWSGKIVQAARQDLPRLKTRGITEATLREVESSQNEVKKLNLARERETNDVPVLALARREAAQAALDWRVETCGLAEAVFDSEPEVLARFRTGVKISRSIPKLVTETGLLLGVVREHLSALRGVGVSEEFVKRGEEALRRVAEVQRRQALEQAQTGPVTADLYRAQGVLYTRTRFLVRIAQVEFRSDEDRLGRYSYATLRRQEVPSTGRRARPATVAAVPE